MSVVTSQPSCDGTDAIITATAKCSDNLLTAGEKDGEKRDRETYTGRDRGQEGRTPRDEVVEDGGAAVVLVPIVAVLIGAQAPRAQLQGAVQEAASRHVDIAAAEAPTARPEVAGSCMVYASTNVVRLLLLLTG